MLSMGWSEFVLNVNVTGKLCAHGRRGGKSAELRMDFCLTMTCAFVALETDLHALFRQRGGDVVVVATRTMLQSHL